jgi:hypothetical protein
MKQARKAISETASENPAHRKRGRPAVYSEQQMNLARQYSDASTVRGKQNFLYMTRAIRVLDYDPEFCWLVGTREEINAGKKVFHNSILTELGRIKDEDTLRDIARRICEIKPRCKDALVMMRRWRTGRTLAGDAGSLTKAIIQTVEDYCAARSDTTLPIILAALANAADAFQEQDSWDPLTFLALSNPSSRITASPSPAPPRSPSSNHAGS